MIKTNLIVGISEDAIGGDPDAVTLKTTSTGNIIIETIVPKVAIKLQDLQDAIAAVQEFIGERPIIIQTTANDDSQPTFEFEYQSSIEDHRAI